MKRNAYSAGAVKFCFWFLEFRKMVELLDAGKTFAEIKTMNEEENIFHISTMARRKQIFTTVSARIRSLGTSFYRLFAASDIIAQKQLCLAATMAHDTLFFDFVFEVIRTKLQLGVNEFTDADVRIFFTHKQMQDEQAAKWTEQTLKRLGQTYKSMLHEAGVIDNGREKRMIYPPLFDAGVELWLKKNDRNEIMQALSVHG